MGFFSSPFSDHHFPIILRRLTTISIVILLFCIQSCASASKVDNAEPRDIKFYKNCEGEIRKALDALSDSDFSKEPKLTRVRRSNGTSYFYPYKKTVKGQHLFIWTPTRSQKNLTSSKVKTLVIAMPNPEKTPFGWMDGTFIALKKLGSQQESTKDKQTHYTALVVYARKDANGMLLEWDRFSINVGKAFEGRKAHGKAVDTASVIARETFLCAYGTCSCNACKKCESAGKNFIAEGEVEAGKVRTRSSNINGNEYNNNMLKDADMIFEGSSRAALVKSGGTNAYANSVTTGSGSRSGSQKSTRAQKNERTGESPSGGNSRSMARSHRGFAMAKSSANADGGESVAAAIGEADSVSDATATDGKAKAMSIANAGFAQSNAESNAGEVVTVAGKSVKGDAQDYDNYDDIEQDNGEEEELDAEQLFKETDQAFEMASKRTHFTRLIAKGDISADMCVKEPEMVSEMDRLELAALLKGAIGEETSKKIRRANRIGMRKAVLYDDSLRFGLDIDGNVNKSVVLAANTNGTVLKRQKCCALTPTKKDSEIMQLLQVFGQDCSGVFQDQVTRLEKNYNVSHISKLMQTKKLSPSQQRDLVPMLLTKAYQDEQEVERTTNLINGLFNNATSQKITLASAIIVNVAYYTASQGDLHKVKIFKGLVDNAQSVWAGVLLEYKKCLASLASVKDATVRKSGNGTDSQCTDEFKDILEIEMNLSLGTILFLKQAYNRYSTNGEPAVEPFISFLQLHNLDIAKQVYCKAKRVTTKIVA